MCFDYTRLHAGGRRKRGCVGIRCSINGYDSWLLPVELYIWRGSWWSAGRPSSKSPLNLPCVIFSVLLLHSISFFLSLQSKLLSLHITYGPTCRTFSFVLRCPSVLSASPSPSLTRLVLSPLLESRDRFWLSWVHQTSSAYTQSPVSPN